MDQPASIWKLYVKFLVWAAPSLAAWFFAWGFLLPKLQKLWSGIPDFWSEMSSIESFALLTRTVIGHFGTGILTIGVLVAGGELISHWKPEFRRPFLAVLAWIINGLVILALISFIMWTIINTGMPTQ